MRIGFSRGALTRIAPGSRGGGSRWGRNRASASLERVSSRERDPNRGRDLLRSEVRIPGSGEALQRERNRWKCACEAAFCLLAAAGVSTAAEADPPLSAPPVELDRLLKLPDSLDLETPRHGGATRSEWRSRFAEARKDLEGARAALEAAQREMGELAGEKSGWQMGAPGVQAMNPENSPVSYELRQEIRRQRDEIERFERRLQELEVEAKLAGVPDEWLAEAEDARPQTQQ